MRSQFSWPTVTVTVAYTLLGLGMLGQPARFDRTPAYGNLTQIVDVQIWGGAYLGVAALLMVYLLRPDRLTAILAHTAGAALTLIWLTAFIVRFATDPGTTIVNVVSWLVFALLLIRSGLGAEDNVTARTP